jgi:ribose transport system ATP-binding protein
MTSAAGLQLSGGREGGGRPAPLLDMRGISKTFPGARALNDVSLSIEAAEIHALMGENGAGKSTLMKILSGAYQADPGGEIRLDGRPVTIDGPLAGKRLGIAIIYQELSLSPNLSVAENIYLGSEPSRGLAIDRAAMNKGCAGILKRLGATFGPASLVADLSIAERQLVEIARAINQNARILVMDEPTTALSQRETERLFALVRQLRDEGLAIIYISHRMAEVYELSDRVSVLRDGSYVGTVGREDINADRIVRMMVGRDISGFYKKEHVARPNAGAPLLSVRDMADGRRVRGCSFDLHAGEVLGLAGLVGSGRTELARLIYGADRRTAGSVTLAGRPLDLSSPGAGLRAGVAYLTEDRKAQGLFLDLTVAENVALGELTLSNGRSGFLPLRAIERAARAAIKALAIRVAGPQIEVGTLSGGNQQKVLLSRLLETKPKVLILDEPTRGVDVGAKSEIYRLIDDLAKSGMGVIVISSELPEIVGIADRILVMREGQIAGEVGGASGAPVTQESIIALATGAVAAPGGVAPR